jgi:hypothetical protein
VRAAAGDAPRALEELTLLLKLARRIGSEPLLLGSYARSGLGGRAIEELMRLAREPGFDAREVRAALAGHLADEDDTALLHEVLLAETAGALELARHSIRGDDMEPYVGASSAWDRWPLAWLRRPLALRDGLAILERREHVVALVRLPPWEARVHADALARIRTPGARIANESASIPQYVVRAMQEHLARIRVARVGLALLAFRQETGAWPETLDAVVPLVGEGTIADPYSGVRFAYAPSESIEAAVVAPDDAIAWRFG